MVKGYIEQREAKAPRIRGEGRGVKSGEDLRRTQPKDQGPLSPKAIDALYKKDGFDGHNLDGPDGLVSKAQHRQEEAIRGPQDPQDKHGPGYNPDVPEGSWLRGGGRAGYGHLDFDYGHYDIANQPAAAPKNAASGKDMTKSPFSAAYRKGAGEGF